MKKIKGSCLAEWIFSEHFEQKYEGLQFSDDGLRRVPVGLSSLGFLLPTMDYAKETMRGGSVLKANVDGKKESSGLELDYAYQ